MIKTLMWVRIRGLLDSMLNRRRGKGAGKGMKILMIILIAYVAIVFGGMFFGLFYAMREPFSLLRMDWLNYSLAGVLATVLCFVGSVFFAQSLIYDAKDNELLLSMPIRSAAIVFSRLSVLYVLNFAYAALIMLPCGLVRLFYTDVTAIGVVGFVAFSFLLPLLPTTLSSLVGGLIAVASARLRNKNLFTLILSLAFLGVYFTVCFNLQGYMNQLVENGAAIGEAISKSMPPFYAMGLALSTGNVRQAARFIAWCVLPFAAVFAVLSRVFISVATMKRGAKKAVYRAGRLRHSSVRVALMKKELRHIAGSSAYLLNAGIGLIMAIGIGILAVVKRADLLNALTNELLLAAEIEIAPYLMPAACAAVCFLMGMSLISAPSISLEGKNLWILQAAPLRAKDVLLAKAMAHLVLAVPSGIITSALLAIALSMKVLDALLLLIVPVVMNVFMAFFGVMINLRCPRFDYVNETVVIKQSMSVTISIFAGMGVVALPVLLYCLWLHRVMSAVCMVLVFTAILAAACYAMYYYLTHKAERAFANLNQD